MKVINKLFHRNYQEVEKYEAGIVLAGAEAKAVKTEGIKLENAFVKIMDDGAYLVNADIPIYHFSRHQGYDSRRRRKLLLHKKELLKLQVKLSGGSNLTIAPVSCYNKGPLVKLEIALAKGRKDIEKRKLEKNRDIKINEKREAKEYVKI
ncbi:SsrA-binding protein [Candidatus Roizmanbacteria bacterium]|nr:SsrA-binding protein [Candidatus Roizmanbacteria bacterium]